MNTGGIKIFSPIDRVKRRFFQRWSVIKNRSMSGSRLSLILLVLILGMMLLPGCFGLGNVPRGWSGAVATDDILFVFSMEGKLVADNITDGKRLWEVEMVETQSSGGLLGCAPASSAVAVYGSPAVSGNITYIGGYTGKVYALVFNRDEPRWVYPREGYLGASIVGGLVVHQDNVYLATSDGRVLALNAADGYREWVCDEINDKVWSTPVIESGTLFIGSFDKKLYAIDINDGSKKWEFETEGAIVATPLVHDGIVYFGSFDRHLYAVDVASGEQVWKFPASKEDEVIPGHWFWSKPVIYNGVLYAGCLDGKVYVIDAISGQSTAGVDYFDLGSSISSSPVVVGDMVIVASEEGIVYALDTGDYQKRQLANLEEKIQAPLAVAQGIVYVHTAKDVLHSIDPETGAVRSFTLNNE
ncbi:MAG: PQQ-like beta-propeller repeat protein [Dehalococcoidales bacterium]|nr:MAG: PQQ-like beta-propeller repeat protein [Dehalococcoidales bacterium]